MIYTTRNHDLNTGEWVFGGSRSHTKNNVDSAHLQIHERLKIYFREVWFDGEAGFPWESVFNSRGIKAEQLLKNLLSDNLAQISGISSFELQNYTYDPSTRKFTIQYRCSIEDYGVSLETITL